MGPSHPNVSYFSGTGPIRTFKEGSIGSFCHGTYKRAMYVKIFKINWPVEKLSLNICCRP